MSSAPAGPTTTREPPFPGFLLVPIALALAAGVHAARPSAPGQPIEPAALDAPADAGNPLVAYGCTACHSLDPGNDTATAPSLAGAAQRGSTRTADPGYAGSAADAQAWLAESIMDHCADEAPGWSCVGVDAYGNWLTQDEVARLVDLLADLPAEAP